MNDGSQWPGLSAGEVAEIAADYVAATDLAMERSRREHDDPKQVATLYDELRNECRIAALIAVMERGVPSDQAEDEFMSVMAHADSTRAASNRSVGNA